MKTKYIILTLITTISLTACKKFIEVEPKQVLLNEKAITTFRDLESVLFGAYDGLQSGNVGGGNVSFYADLMADDLEPLSNKLAPFGTQEIFDGATSVQISALRDMWRDSYATINRCNNVIDVIDNNRLNGSDFEQNKNRFKAEALFIRSLVNYNLLQLWALPYDVNNKGNNIQPGIVLRTLPIKEFDDPNIKAQRNTVEECYAQIIKDLSESENLFSISGLFTSTNRASQNASRALLARVSLVCGNYAAATSYAKQIINSGTYTLASDSSKFLTLYQVNGDNLTRFPNLPEVICQLVNTREDNVGNLDGSYSINNFLRLKFDITDLFQAEDDRPARLIQSFGSKFTLKHRKAAGVIIPNNIILLRLAEMYLVLAEASVLANNSVTIEALTAYNTLRQRNIGYDFIAENTTDVNDFLNKVRLERRLELMCENGDRYTTLRRLGLPLGSGSTNYGKYLFKIPQEEIAGNPEIIQNP
jgi:hypothetical protein